MKHTIIGLLLSLISAAAFAGEPPAPVPEPGTLALLGGAVAAGLFIARNRRK